MLEVDALAHPLITGAGPIEYDHRPDPARTPWTRGDRSAALVFTEPSCRHWRRSKPTIELDLPPQSR